MVKQGCIIPTEHILREWEFYNKNSKAIYCLEGCKARDAQLLGETREKYYLAKVVGRGAMFAWTTLHSFRGAGSPPAFCALSPPAFCALSLAPEKALSRV